MEPTVERRGRVYGDESGIQAHSGLSNGFRASHSRSELQDLGEKDVYSSYTRPEEFTPDDRCAMEPAGVLQGLQPGEQGP